MGGAGAVPLAMAVLGAEVLGPLLLLCWLCCWPTDKDKEPDADDTSSSGNPPKELTVLASGSRRGSQRSPARRLASSAASLHLPGPSGSTSKQPLSSHRSHEEIPRRRRSALDARDDDSRYHSAPSVIDEVIHRRDWERSSKELYIPLRPPEAELPEFGALDEDDRRLEAPRAEPETSSVASRRGSPERVPVACKKHHTNIKSSKNRTTKEAHTDDVKDTDATESGSRFHIGQTGIKASKHEHLAKEEETVSETNKVDGPKASEEKTKPTYKAKEAKQTFNESIKTKKPADMASAIDVVAFAERRPVAWCQVGYLTPDLEDATDRSGAEHRGLESRGSLPYVTTPLPPPSVEPLEYAACGVAPPPAIGVSAPVGVGVSASSAWRTRTASDGAIPPPAQRPQSGAFSESDLEPLCEACPPPFGPTLTRLPPLCKDIGIGVADAADEYSDPRWRRRARAAHDNKETAI